MIGKGPGVEYWLMSFQGALWDLSIFKIIMSSGTFDIITLISLASVSLVLSQDSLFLVWGGCFEKLYVFLRPMSLISSTSDFSSFRLVVRLAIWFLISSI